MAVELDRDLLFGIFALKMDFVDAGEFVTSLQAWREERGEKLQDIVVRTQHVCGNDRQRIAVPDVEADMSISILLRLQDTPVFQVCLPTRQGGDSTVFADRLTDRQEWTCTYLQVVEMPTRYHTPSSTILVDKGAVDRAVPALGKRAVTEARDLTGATNPTGKRTGT